MKNADVIIFAVFMLEVAVCDIKTFQLPLRNIYACFILLFFLRLFFYRAEFLLYIFSSVLLFLCFFTVYIFQKEKLGFGDVQLSLCMGLLNGLSGAFAASVISCLLALFFILFVSMILKKKAFEQKVPFAPFLIAGSLIERMFHTAKIVEQLF